MNTQPTFLRRGLALTLSFLFFIIPLVYAWFYIPWIPVTLADIFPQLGGFEKVKVLFFLWLLPLAVLFFLAILITNTLEQFRDSKKMKLFFFPKYKLIGIFIIWSILSYIVNQDINPYFLLGNAEKFHGWYLYQGFLMFGIMISASSREEQKKYLNISLISGGIVCLYALFQKLWLDPIQSLYSSRLDETRIFSTLGNPNYLAGYILMLMPLSLFLAHSRKILWWGLFGFFTLILFWTKSLFGIGVFIGYLSYLILYRLAPLKQQTRHIITFSTVVFVIIVSGYIIIQYGHQIIEIQKIKGFIARYFLWETGIHTLFGDIRNTLFGYGPDGFLPVSEIFRSPELAIFEDAKFRIDRSHNVWIDFLIHFGIPVGGFIIYWIFSQWKRLPLSHKEVLVLFSIFFFFNIPVLVHFILLLQILIVSKESPKPLKM